jgi:crotonobetainyl-CoA:carnitine CoA-transferase CaiB-like acyl-CoA transferase
MIHHPQVEASGIVVETEHPHAGRLRQARNAARFEATPAEIRHGAPHHGEHTRAIMSELGFSNAEIDGLIADGVIGDFQLAAGSST